jgi:gentisate 1,2-dioxygenase
MAALRFVIEGSGAYTEIDGRRITMSPGDLVLTPAWSRHGHGNDTSAPIVWMDGLDAPLVRMLRADFFKRDDDHRDHGTGGEGEAGDRSGAKTLVYRWIDVYARLELQRPSGGNGELVEEYTDPATGGPVLPTMACFLRLIRAGHGTPVRRQTGNTIYFVVRGSGRTTVEAEELQWRRGDILAVPSWLWHAHAAEGEDAVLFSFTDTPVLRALGLYREESGRP